MWLEANAIRLNLKLQYPHICSWVSHISLKLIWCQFVETSDCLERLKHVCSNLSFKVSELKHAQFGKGVGIWIYKMTYCSFSFWHNLAGSKFKFLVRRRDFTASSRPFKPWEMQKKSEIITLQLRGLFAVETRKRPDYTFTQEAEHEGRVSPKIQIPDFWKKMETEEKEK